MPEITEELMAWGNRTAERYEKIYGDPDGQFSSAVGPAIVEAAREFQGKRVDSDFSAYIKGRTKQRLNRIVKRKMRRPVVLSLLENGDDDTEPRSFAGPVGWEVDYEDLVETLAEQVSGASAMILRLVFLEAKAGSSWKAAPYLDLTNDQAHSAYRWAIEKLRRIYAPLPKEAWDLFHDAS